MTRIFISKYNQAQTYIREFNTQLNVIFVESIIIYFKIKTTTLIKKLTINSFIDRIDFYVI